MNIKMKLMQVWMICIGVMALLLAAGIAAPINDLSGGALPRFIGRFHVLVLHFPVVLILLAPALDLLARREDLRVLRPLLPWFWSLTALSAVAAALLGLTLAASEGYSAEMVADHRFEGIAVAILSAFVVAVRFSLFYYPSQWMRVSFSGLVVGLVALTFTAAHAGGNLVRGEAYLVAHAPKFVQQLAGYEDPLDSLDWVASDYPEFNEKVQPLLVKYCQDCHGVDQQRGNLRIDVLNPDLIGGSDAPIWHEVLDALNAGEMPPKEKSQPNLEEREVLVAWLTEELELAAESKKDDVNPVLRRLTKQQYTNTLQELLGLDIDFSVPLPDDGKSLMGFDNSASILQTSPLHLDNYQAIARSALDKALSIGPRPETTRVRVTIGEEISSRETGGYIGGFQSRPLKREHFHVDFLDEQGNPKQPTTDEDKKRLLDAQSLVSIGQRGSSLNRYRVVKEGMMLNAALPHAEAPPKSWQGPSPHMALQLKRDFPRVGDFEFRVKASKGYIPEGRRELFIAHLGASTPINTEEGSLTIPDDAIVLSLDDAFDTRGMKRQGDAFVPENVAGLEHGIKFKVNIPEEGVYRVDIVHPTPEEGADAAILAKLAQGLTMEARNTALKSKKIDDKRSLSTIGTSYLAEGERTLELGGQFFVGVHSVVIAPLELETLSTRMQRRLELGVQPENKSDVERTPSIRTYVGTRTDDGLDYAEFGVPQEVTSQTGDATEYVFRGRLENLPLPAAGTSSEGADALAGIMMVGLWNDHLVKSADDTGPPLLVESVEFIAPVYDAWPSASHRAIFFESDNVEDEERYTKEVLERFMSRAFRRPAEQKEVERYMSFWREIRPQYNVYEASVKEVLTAVLSSPLFLFMPVNDHINPQNDHAEFALASRLSYFLWNSPPDDALLAAAEEEGGVLNTLKEETARMIEDQRFRRFIEPFAMQWLRLDRHESALIDPKIYPDFSRFVRRDLAQETYHFLHHVFSENLPITTLVDSDFAMLNQNLAEFYGIENVVGHNFRPVPVSASLNRGGLLSQGAFLSGHSDGIDGHPIKRAIWVMEKILGDEPPPPPPNVADLDPDTPGFEKLTLKEQLEMHRDKDSCRSCHQRIDPYGIVFENYDASGRWRDTAKGRPVDSSSTLPDGSEVEGVSALKAYILEERRDDFVRTVIEHIYAYALGRDIHFSDEKAIESMLEHVQQHEYRAQSLIEAVVTSEGFLNKKTGGENEKAVATR